MTISKSTVRVLLALAVSAGLGLSAGFGPARAVESTETNRGNGDQTKTTTAVRNKTTSAVKASRSGPRVGRPKRVIIGTASYYGGKFHGRRTYNGERYNMYAMTLACRRLPMGTRVRVTNLKTGRSAVGRVNDFGPNGRHKNRVADLSVGLAKSIGFSPSQGLTRVKMEVIK